MKKIFLTIATAALFTVNSFAANTAATTNEGDNATYAAVTKFNTDFVKAENVTWKVTGNFQKATFTIDGNQMSAFYSLRGELLGTTQTVQYKALPEKAKKEIAAKYEGYFAKEVIKYETGEDNSFENTVYFVDLKKGTDEFLLKVTPSSNVAFFQAVK
ncbi:hypothetical protein DYU05_03685 [Mucilaginibacter terrenus]|uniref:Beta-lactamase-inhibitor-like PepSY-like domain-containing protein n=1 Tax=Mucilaginibacter terrenus TaxID=2482727 RepID=A0A3E2NV41_9SPHI|nr:hypothetical protein [Mucilaginibacter terrenus]RFZ84720.1 hypothetical protein DYU05_03685 [Mucilaginibacter terrenus]